VDPTARRRADQPRKTPQSGTDPRPRPKRQPPYAVILHRDPVNGFNHVTGALRKVFLYSAGKAVWLTFRAHLTGRSVVWSGHLELAELKAEQLRGCGPDPRMNHRGARPLAVSTEPIPSH
jgi:ATP-dependent Clp protease adaptor protein ClpS